MYPGANAPHDPLATAESATLFVASPHFTAAAFDAAGIARSSPTHTKNRLAIAHGDISTLYWSVGEHVLASGRTAKYDTGRCAGDFPVSAGLPVRATHVGCAYAQGQAKTRPSWPPHSPIPWAIHRVTQ